jgi:hypothetical protein
MANNEQKKTIPLSTIPTSKLTVILNNFIVNTVNHLNKLSLNVDEKLSEFDKKLNDLEVMTTLFEAKLESLPDEIKSTYPPLQPCSLDDVNPVFSGNSNNNIDPNKNKKVGEKTEEKEKEGEGEGEEAEGEGEEAEGEGEGGGEQNELSPEEDLKQFLDKNTGFQNIFRMLKVGVPIISAEQKVKLNGFDMDLFNELVEKAKKVYPNIN